MKAVEKNSKKKITKDDIRLKKIIKSLIASFRIEGITISNEEAYQMALKHLQTR